MTNFLKLKPSNCKNCYKCIRNCPVKSIKFSNNQAYIVESECVLCGKCFVTCPQNAKEIRNDVYAVKAMLQNDMEVYASIAPAFVANYDGVNIESVRCALKKLGFADVYETAEGAAMVKTSYEKLIAENKHNVLISSCCHSVNLLIQKHYPEALQYIAPVKSPMLANCEQIKREHPEAKTVFIGPCISKKAEAEQYKGAVDCVLTFEELTDWMKSEQVKFEPCEDNSAKGRTRLFPTAGGILRSMNCDHKGYSYIAVDGMENCISAIEDVIAGNITDCFIEMSACEGSCINGPVIEKVSKGRIRDFVAVNKYAGSKDFEFTMPSDEEMFKNIPFIGVQRSMPGAADIEAILRKMGKTKPEDELNCGSCGYNTCREKAIAVYQGKADLSMCLPFLKDKAETFSDTIINNTPNGIFVLNEELEIQQINASARDMLKVTSADNVIGEPIVRLLDPLPYMEVLSDGRNVRKRQTYLAEYGKYVEETILYDRSYRVLISIMRDITDEEKAHEKKEAISKKTMEITDKVIEKQMRIVQEIASLLGETTAETKIALTKLKESLQDE